MSYIVWSHYPQEGWQPSDELETLDEVYRFITGDQCQPEFKITKTVEVHLTEAGSGPGIGLLGPAYPPGARGIFPGGGVTLTPADIGVTTINGDS
jgi:hypothetical protein